MEPGPVICCTPATVPVVLLCNYAWSRAGTSYVFHFCSLVPAPVQLGKHSIDVTRRKVETNRDPLLGTVSNSLTKLLQVIIIILRGTRTRMHTNHT